MARPEKISPNETRVLEVLKKSPTPLAAYDILEKLRRYGVKAPPTVYRALDRLIERGLVHRIETLSAFVACHDHGDAHAAQFAVCRSCGTAEEIHDGRLDRLLEEIGQRLAFRIEREMTELLGLCRRCQPDAVGA